MPPPLTEGLGPLFGPVAAALWGVSVEPVLLLYAALVFGLSAPQVEQAVGQVVQTTADRLAVAVAATVAGLAGVVGLAIAVVTVVVLLVAWRRGD